jgi:hypothetical protein
MQKKIPYAKPIPKNFLSSWNDTGVVLQSNQPPPSDMFQQQPPPTAITQFPPPGPDCIPLAELQRQATAVVAFGNVYPVLPGSNLFMSILGGERAVKDVIRTEFLSG